MRITLVSQYYPPERGAVRYSQNLAVGQTRLGHEVTVIAGLPHFPSGVAFPAFGRWKPVIRKEAGVRVIRTPLIMGSNRQPLRRIMGFFTFALSAICWASFTRRTDVMIASVPPATSVIPGILGATIRGIPLIVLLRDIEPMRALQLRGMAESLWGRLLIRVFMWLYRFAALVVVVHDAEKESLKALGVSLHRIKVIPHGIDFAAYDAQAHREACCPLGRTNGRILVLYMGTIGVVHGIDSLLRAIADDRIRRLPVDFVIIGDGEERDKCCETIRNLRLENVRLLPSIPLELVASCLTQADILLCSFRNDADIPLGFKFYEYCAAGKPLLIYGRNLAGDLVERIGNGKSCAAGDAERFCEALSDFVTRPGFWREEGLHGRKYAQEHFCQSNRDAQWDRVLKSVLAP